MHARSHLSLVWGRTAAFVVCFSLFFNPGFLAGLSCFLIKCISLATCSSHLLYPVNCRLSHIITPYFQLCLLSLHSGVHPPSLPWVIFGCFVSWNQSPPQPPNNLSETRHHSLLYLFNWILICLTKPRFTWKFLVPCWNCKLKWHIYHRRKGKWDGGQENDKGKKQGLKEEKQRSDLCF